MNYALNQEVKFVLPLLDLLEQKKEKCAALCGCAVYISRGLNRKWTHICTHTRLHSKEAGQNFLHYGAYKDCPILLLLNHM